MIDWRYLDFRKGLTIPEMIELARKVGLTNWTELSGYQNEKAIEPGGLFGSPFPYDFLGRLEQLEIYLSKNAANRLWDDGFAIKVFSGNTPLGFSGRRNRREFPDLTDLCSDVAEHISKSRKELERSIILKRQQETEFKLEETRRKYF